MTAPPTGSGDTMKAYSVYVHAFRDYQEEGQCFSEYCDFETQTPTGWCVYLRSDEVGGEGFEVVEEWDFTTYDAAISHAETVSARMGGLEIEIY